jgi:tRNA(Ile)-lysidine synthase
MKNPLDLLRQFFIRKKLQQQSFLLGLSGGTDSLCLFRALVKCQKEFSFKLHIAHIDHGWREESQAEAKQLQQIAEACNMPFYVKKLNPSLLRGNLEAACREERYRFFKDIYEQFQCDGLFLGHHGDDQSETVLKKLLEGSSWMYLSGLQEESSLYGMRLLRPFVLLSKNHLAHWLETQKEVPFEDRTNQDKRFLRARMRQTILPWLSQNFGKEVKESLIQIASEASELRLYFDQRLSPILNQKIEGKMGVYLDLCPHLPVHSIELKYLFKRIAEQSGFYICRDLLERGAFMLQNKEANKKLIMGKQTFVFDRGRLFLLKLQPQLPPNPIPLDSDRCGPWKIAMESQTLPKGNYQVGLAPPHALYLPKKCSLDKWWTHCKVPAFLRQTIPVIWKEGRVYHEFLSGYSFIPSFSDSFFSIRLFLD